MAYRMMLPRMIQSQMVSIPSRGEVTEEALARRMRTESLPRERYSPTVGAWKDLPPKRPRTASPIYQWTSPYTGLTIYSFKPLAATLPYSPETGERQEQYVFKPQVGPHEHAPHRAPQRGWIYGLRGLLDGDEWSITQKAIGAGLFLLGLRWIARRAS